jgi:hypothetical protein
LTLSLRNPSKLESFVPPAIIEAIETIVVGDGSNSEGMKRIILDHDTEAIINVSGGQVFP